MVQCEWRPQSATKNCSQYGARISFSFLLQYRISIYSVISQPRLCYAVPILRLKYAFPRIRRKNQTGYFTCGFVIELYHGISDRLRRSFRKNIISDSFIYLFAEQFVFITSQFMNSTTNKRTIQCQRFYFNPFQANAIILYVL